MDPSPIELRLWAHAASSQVQPVRLQESETFGEVKDEASEDTWGAKRSRGEFRLQLSLSASVTTGGNVGGFGRVRERSLSRVAGVAASVIDERASAPSSGPASSTHSSPCFSRSTSSSTSFIIGCHVGQQYFQRAFLLVEIFGVEQQAFRGGW